MHMELCMILESVLKDGHESLEITSEKITLQCECEIRNTKRLFVVQYG